MASKKAPRLSFKEAIAKIEERFGIVGVYAVNVWVDIEHRIDWDKE